MKNLGLIEFNLSFFWQIFNTITLVLLGYLIIKLTYTLIRRLSNQDKIEALEERVKQL